MSLESISIILQLLKCQFILLKFMKALLYCELENYKGGVIFVALDHFLVLATR